MFRNCFSHAVPIATGTSKGLEYRSAPIEINSVVSVIGNSMKQMKVALLRFAIATTFAGSPVV